MKLKYREKIGQNGEIRIPSDYMTSLGLCPGEEVELRLAGRQVLIQPLDGGRAKPAKSVVDKLYGALKLNQELIEEIAHGGYVPEDV